MNPATAKRPEIREFVRANEEDKARVVAGGGNAAQVDLDQDDALHELIKDLDNEQKQNFLDIYTQEKIALISDSSEKQFAAASRKAEKAVKQKNKIGGVVLILIVIVSALMLLKK